MSYQGWTTPTPPPAAPRTRRRHRPRWRPLTWVILVFNALMLLWLVAVISATPGAHDDCGASETCQAGTEFTAAAVSLVTLIAWTAGDIILGVVWLVTNKASGRAARRPDPPPPSRRW